MPPLWQAAAVLPMQFGGNFARNNPRKDHAETRDMVRAAFARGSAPGDLVRWHS
jgi:hypothetical protein